MSVFDKESELPTELGIDDTEIPVTDDRASHSNG
jgi:hypothetical protein